MESSKLTDEELIEIAKNNSFEDTEEVWDLKYYQQSFNIVSGKYKIRIEHLYHHYHSWSANPVEILEFKKILNADNDCIYVDQNLCNFSIIKVVGDYVKEQKRIQKEERLRKVSSIKSKTKRKD